MPDIRYNTDHLRQGGRISRQASDEADSAGTAVSGAPVAAGPFGNVSSAASLASVLAQAQQNHAKGAHTAAVNRDVAGQRADTTAAAGDELTAVTTVVAQSGTAQSGTAQSVADGMT
jgi:hypothetical protein